MPSKPKGAMIISHLQQEGSCSLGHVIVERGMRIHTRNSPRYGLEDIDPLRPDLLVVMGGPVGVYQADDYPFLKTEIEILRARINADLPTMGICLGAQLIAAAAGAKVHKGEQGKEVGWDNLTLTEAGIKSPVRYLCGSQTNMFHWHGDTFDLPETAERLASTDLYENQIFSIGKNILGVQCHPEVQETQLQEWYVMFHKDITGDKPLIPVEQLRKETTQNIATLNRQAKLFFNAWLESVGL